MSFIGNLFAVVFIIGIILVLFPSLVILYDLLKRHFDLPETKKENQNDIKKN